MHTDRDFVSASSFSKMHSPAVADILKYCYKKIRYSLTLSSVDRQLQLTQRENKTMNRFNM